MQSYTEDSQTWLDQRFRETDECGIYFAHQPIYGFRRGHSEPGIVSRYSITYHAMKALSLLHFSTLLDVGGAEGYKAALVRTLFGATVRVADLSQEACDRANDLYAIEGDAVDILHLPFEDNSFDVVLCSETLEHVPDLEAATKELVRVSRRAVVITVPHDPKRVVARNIRERTPHGHIHCLKTTSFEFIADDVSKIIVRKIAAHPTYVAFALAEGTPRKQVGAVPRAVIRLYNALTPIVRKVCTQRVVEELIALDAQVAAHSPLYRGLIVTLLKDRSSYSSVPVVPISIQEIIDFSVPFHTIPA